MSSLMIVIGEIVSGGGVFCKQNGLRQQAIQHAGISSIRIFFLPSDRFL